MAPAWRIGDELYDDALTWTWGDGSFFFQDPATSGQGSWVLSLTLPNGTACNVPFQVT